MSNKSLHEQIMEKIDNLPFSSDIEEGEGTTVHHIWKYNNIKVTDEITNAISDEVSWRALDKIVKKAIKHGERVALDLEDFDYSDSTGECNRVFHVIDNNSEKFEIVFTTPLLLSILQSATDSTFQFCRDDETTEYDSLMLKHVGDLINDETNEYKKMFYIIAADIEGIIYNRDDIKIKIDSIDVRDTDVTEDEDRVELSLKCRMSVSDNVKVLMGEEK